MNQSEINHVIPDAQTFLAEKHFHLPSQAYSDTVGWKGNTEKISEILENLAGLNITDFDSGDFYFCGLFLFILSNGKHKMDKKAYAEIIMILVKNQQTQMHYHWSKMEDIINRSGGNLMIEWYNRKADNQLDQFSPVRVKIDGISREIELGKLMVLTPGKSVCQEHIIHLRFHGKQSKGKVVKGKLSAVNEETSDGWFHEKTGKQPNIHEDYDPLHLLVSGYHKIL